MSVYENPVFARWTATTGADGKFRIAGVKTGKILFQITGRRINSLKETRDLTDANDASGQRPGQPLRLPRDPDGAGQVGTVLAKDGSPVPSAAIFVAPAIGQFVIVRDPTEQGGDLRRGEATTAEDGKFPIEGLTLAQHRVVAAAPGFASASRIRSS